MKFCWLLAVLAVDAAVGKPSRNSDASESRALIPGSTWFPILPQFSQVDYGKALTFLTNKNTISLFVVRDMMQVYISTLHHCFPKFPQSNM